MVVPFLGTAHNLVKCFKDKVMEMCDWYCGDVIKIMTVEFIKSEIGNQRLTSLSTAANYIKKFVSAYRELNKIPGKSILVIHVLSLFIGGIIDPDFQISVQVQRNNDGLLMDAAIVVREHKM